MDKQRKLIQRRRKSSKCYAKRRNCLSPPFLSIKSLENSGLQMTNRIREVYERVYFGGCDPALRRECHIKRSLIKSGFTCNIHFNLKCIRH
ncbi:hypothetical protein ACTXT7_004751 [Hymenolepis weldensis]